MAFLRAIDRNLGKPAVVMVIGGAAAAVAYHSDTRTADIDVFRGMTADLAAAAHEARRETGLAIAVSAAPVADLPYNYEERVRPGRGLSLRRLAALFPDKYDLVLSKAVRGYQHDVDAIEGIHRRHRLSLKTLVERFEGEMSQAIGDPRRIRLNMVMVAARLYGDAQARSLAERWGVPAPW
ncbi:MAG TPA: DUF6036 family nucleotidyltransferase [Vicinamibacteria bacterium]|nr:DUF6036 family nucleotidyltransferase [Vicinamibacteria bacterium]